MNILIILFGILTIISLGYYVCAATYAGLNSTFLWFWLFLAIICIVVIVLLVLNKKNGWIHNIPKIIKFVASIVFIIGIVLFVTLEGMIISKMNVRGDKNASYIIVLGAQVRGEKVTKSLAKRLDAAYDYLNDNKETIVICSGGKGAGEDISEALAMKRYLIDKGIDEDRIITEDKSKNTYENLKYSLDIIGDASSKVVVVTSNFHIYRALHLAKYVGFDKVSGLAGKSDNKLLPNYMIRESLALLKDLIMY